MQLFDSGGTQGDCIDGSDRSALKRFKLNLIGAELLPELQATDVIDVWENEERGGGFMVFTYFGNTLAAPTIPSEEGNVKLISDVAFELHCYNPEHFEGATGVPRIDDVGTLTFASAYGFYGDSTVSFRLVSTSGRTTPWSNFTIRVHPINQPPAFQLQLFDSQWCALAKSNRTCAMSGCCDDCDDVCFLECVATMSWLDSNDTLLLNHAEAFSNCTSRCTENKTAPLIERVSLTVTLTFTMEEFNDEVQGRFKEAVAEAAGLETNDVIIEHVTAAQIGTSIDISIPIPYHQRMYSFDFNCSVGYATIVKTLEDHSPWQQHHFARSISKGLFLEASELGVYYSDSPYRANEEHQHLTFMLEIVDGNTQLFDALSMSANGTFAFKLAPHENGHAQIRVTLVDDGGTVGEYDDDTSEPSFITVVVRPVNDQPIFSFNESITLLEKSESYVHRSHDFIYNWFWSDYLGNFQGPANELDQSLTFIFEGMTGSTVVFDSPPDLGMDGVVALHIGGYSWGESVLSFTAQDDGGTAFGGLDTSDLQKFTLKIMPVNTRPTIGLPIDVYMWVNCEPARLTQQENSIMIAQKCCSPCPGPNLCDQKENETIRSCPQVDTECHQCNERCLAQFGGANATNSSDELSACLSRCYLQSDAVCDCVWPDETGTMYMVPAALNSSAGPYEDDTQNVTFTVVEQGNLLDSQIVPHIRADGSLVMRLDLGAAGVTNLTISVRDDGGLENLPHQQAHNNRTHQTSIHVLPGFVEMSFRVQALLFEDMGVLEIRRRVASCAGTREEMVVVQKVHTVDATTRSNQGVNHTNSTHNASSTIAHFIETSSCFDGTICNEIADAACSNGTSCSGDGRAADSHMIELKLRVAATNIESLFQAHEALSNASARHECGFNLWTSLVRVSDIFSRCTNELTPKPPSFTVPPVIMVDEDTAVVQDIVTDIAVDSGVWVQPDQQQIQTSVQLLRTKAPATSPNWDSTNNETVLVLNQSVALLTNCDPYCHNASLQLLPARHRHGMVELRVTISSLLSNLSTSKTVLVVFRPVPDRPVALGPLIILEDGGFCLVPACRSTEVSFLAYDFIGDADEWFRGGNTMQVTSSQPSRLNATIIDGNDIDLVLQPGLHQHGTFNVTATDGDGLQTTPPLIVIVQHVNHPPYLEHVLPNITMHEDGSTQDLIFNRYFTDVDMIDQQDELATVDWMNFSVRSLTPWLINGQSLNQNLSMQPLANMHGLAALRLTATDSLGANVSAVLLVNITPVPDRPFVQRSLPELQNGTLRVPENSPDVRINVSFVFGDVDNCSLLIVQEACMFGPAGADSHVLTVNSSRPWKVNGTLERDDLVLHFFPFEHSHSDDEIQINLTATDAFGLERVLPIAVIVEPIQTIPQAFLPDVHMIENQEPRFIHVTTAEEAQGDFAFIDHDSYTNLYGDSVKFEAETSEPDLLEVVMLTQAQTAAGAPAVDCVFPFTFAGITYENCTTAGTGLHGPRGYQARFSWCSLDGSELTGDVIAALQANRIAKCKHSLKISSRPGHFGRAKVVLTAFDSFGGVGVGEFNVAVSMVNDPPLFTVPSVFEVNRASTLGSERDTRVVKHFAIVRSLGFQQSAPELPSAEDFCRVMPVRLKGDCHSLPPLVLCNTTHDDSAGFIVAISLAVDMSMQSFDREKQYFLAMGIARTADVEASMVLVQNITEEQTDRRRFLLSMDRHLSSVRLQVDVAILAGHADAAALISTRLTHRNVNSELQRIGMNPVEILKISTDLQGTSVPSPEHDPIRCIEGTVGMSRCPNMTSRIGSLSFCPQNATQGQQVTFFVQHLAGDIAIFQVEPTISWDGTLMYELKQFRTGRVTFNVTLVDNGGTEYGGINQSSSSFSIDVLPLNIRPYFDMPLALDVIENGMFPQTIERKWTESNFAFNINPGGGAADIGQNLTFVVTQVGGTHGLFATNPRISSEGTLFLELSQDYHGKVNLSVVLVDDGMAGVDKDGWDRSEHNDNTSDIHLVEINVIQLNNPPVFCLPDSLILVEGSREQIDGWIPVSPGASTLECTHPAFNPYGKERQQNLTFTVFAGGDLIRDKNSEGLDCAPFDYDHSLGHVREISWFRIYPNGSLDVNAVNSGQGNVSITLVDDGGIENGGVNTTTHRLLVIVQDVNDQPYFDFVYGGLVLVYEGIREPPAVATNISSGRCERPEQPLSFIISALDFCVPDCPGAPLGSSVDQGWRLFEDSGTHQLFQGAPDSIHMDSQNGTLFFTLAPFRNGRVLLNVKATDGHLHFERNVTLIVEPVNSPPEFELESLKASLYEKLRYADEYTADFTADQMLYRKHFFLSIKPGGFDEDEQQLRFGVTSVSNPGLVACVEVVCDESATLGAGCQPQPGLDLPWVGTFGSCNGTAMLRVWATPSRYGDEILQIVLMDNGPLQPANVSPYGWLGAPRPDNNSSRLLTIHMIRFRLATSIVEVFENSSCMSEPPFSSMLSHAKCNRSGVPFQHIRQGFVVDVPPSQQQNVTFHVVAHEPVRSPPVPATEIFSSWPYVSADGTLSFVLTPSAFGTTKFTVWLEDAAKRTSHNVSFDLVVININNRPSVNLPARIVAFEDEPFQYIVGNRVSRDTFGNAVLDWEYDQLLTFGVQALQGDLFAVAPSLKEMGTRFEADGVTVELSFRTAPLVFGTTSLQVRVQDDGGTAVGGEDTLEKLILLEIVAINEAPHFEILESVFIFESPEPHYVQDFAFDMLAGPENERGLCAVFPGDCQDQKISYELDSISNPNLFVAVPQVNAGGTLSFRACEYCSGTTSICLQAVDTGSSSVSFSDCVACSLHLPAGVSCCFAGTESSRPVGTHKSETKCSNIHIEPIDHAPGFRLPWDVNCSTQLLSNFTKCTCRTTESLVHKFMDGVFMGLDGSAESVCTPKDQLDHETVVAVLEDSGQVQIKNFASSISAAEGFSQPSNAIFGGDDQDQRLSSGQISFRGQRPDSLLSTRGLEFASHMQESGDGTLYFAEPETNSVSMWTRSGDSATFEDRRTNDEVRIRFRSLEDVDPMLMSTTGERIQELQNVCSLHQHESSTDGSVLAGAGCELLSFGDAFEQNSTFKSEPEWEHIVGDWYFDSGAMYNMDNHPMKVNQFSQHVKQTIDCSGSFCRYERPKLGCDEHFATSIGPASFRDRSNQMGAAVFVGDADVYGGAKCKSELSEFDTPADHTLSVANLLGSVGEVEAMHFDTLVSSGLLITDDIDELVDGNPTSSKLPVSEMTADIVFQLGTSDATEHGLFSAMQSRTCDTPSEPENCGCNKGMRIAWQWADSFSGSLTLSLAIALERPSADPTMYSEDFLKFTGTNVGPGLGVAQFFEWTSPPGFAWPGDWVHAGFTYDGRFARLFLNGSEAAGQHMCSTSCPPDEPECACGNIIYPAAYHTCPEYCECPTEECKRLKCPCGSNGPTLGFRACSEEKTPVAIGTYIHTHKKRFDTHNGMIHHVRLFKKALGKEYFQAQQIANAHILLQKSSSSLDGKSSGSHFFQSNGQGNPDAPLCQPALPPPSPSVSYVDVNLAPTNSVFKIHGLFRCPDSTAVKFRARFLYTYAFPSRHTVHLDTSECEVELSSCGGNPMFSDTLHCALPSDREWKHGYKAAVLTILESNNDGTQYYLVSKACFSPSCGYIAKSLRAADSEGMIPSAGSLPRSKWTVLSGCCHTLGCAGGQYLYSTAISGALSYFRFVTHSQLITVATVDDAVTLVSLFVPRETSTAGRTDMMRFGTFESQQEPFSGHSSLLVLGVSSVRSFTMENETFLLVANYWDGKESHILSHIFRVNDNADGADMQLTALQGVPTAGARDMQFMRVQGVPFIIVANFEGDSEVFRWRGKGSISYVDVLDAGHGYVDGDVGLICRLGPRGDACRRENSLEHSPFLAKMTVDGKPNGRTERGKIVSISVVRTFKTMTDVDVEIFYPGTREPMERTITTVWSSQVGTIFCKGVGGGIRLSSTHGGFQASAELVDGRMHNVDIVHHGRGFNDVPDMVVQTENGTACQCLDSLRLPLPWTACVRVSIPHASHRCVGGDRDGSTCGGVEDELSCRGSREVIDAQGNKVLNSGTCEEPRPHPVTGRSRAKLSLGPILDAPVRTRSRRLREEPAWREAPGISSQFPADISDGGKINLGKAAGISGAASGLVTFERGPVTYCVISMYLDPEHRSETMVDSRVIKMSIDASSGDLLVDEVQRLPTNGAYSVSMLSMPFCRSVCGLEMGREVCKSACDAEQTFVFIPSLAGTFSPLYLWHEDTQMFGLLQRVRTAKAVTAEMFQYFAPSSNWYVTVGQMDTVGSKQLLASE